MNKEKFINWSDKLIEEFDLMIQAHGIGTFEACSFVVKKNLVLLIKSKVEDGNFDE